MRSGSGRLWRCASAGVAALACVQAGAAGAGPLVLPRATPAGHGASMSLADRMPGHAADAASAAIAAAAAPAALASAAASASAPANAPPESAPRAPWLWTALVAGLAMLGAIAWAMLHKAPPPLPAPREGT